MDHWEFKEAVHNYRMKSGHAINYYDGGAENSPINRPGEPYTGKRKVQKGSLAKDKMRDLHGRADGSVNQGMHTKYDTTLINDTR